MRERRKKWQMAGIRWCHVKVMHAQSLNRSYTHAHTECIERVFEKNGFIQRCLIVIIIFPYRILKRGSYDDFFFLGRFYFAACCKLFLTLWHIFLSAFCPLQSVTDVRAIIRPPCSNSQASHAQPGFRRD